MSALLLPIASPHLKLEKRRPLNINNLEGSTRP